MDSQNANYTVGVSKRMSDRFCCLRGNDQIPLSPGDGCSSRRHRHLSEKNALDLVEAGYAERERAMIVTYSRKGVRKERFRDLPVIRICRFRRWRKTLSRSGYQTVAVMQLKPCG